MDLRYLAMAFRLNNMLPFLGIIEEDHRTNLESFVLTIYNTCIERNYSATTVIENSFKLFKISNDLDIPVPQIPNFIREKQSEKHKLELEIAELNKHKQLAEQATADALEKNKVTQEEQEEFMVSKIILQEHNLSIRDYNRLVNTIKNTKELNYDIGQIVTSLSEEHSRKQRLDDLDTKIASRNTTIEEQEKTIRWQDDQITVLRQTRESFILHNTKLAKQLKRKHTAKISKDMDLASIGYILCSNIRPVKERIESISLKIIGTKGWTVNDSFDSEINKIEMATQQLDRFFLKWHENKSLDIALATAAAKVLRDNLDVVSNRLKQLEGKLNDEQADRDLAKTLKLIKHTRNTADQFNEMISLGGSDYPLLSSMAE